MGDTERREREEMLQRVSHVLYISKMYIHVWQPQVENEHYSYLILTTISEFMLL